MSAYKNICRFCRAEFKDFDDLRFHFYFAHPRQRRQIEQYLNGVDNKLLWLEVAAAEGMCGVHETNPEQYGQRTNVLNKLRVVRGEEEA